MITESMLKKYSEAYNASPERQLATMALAKSELPNVCFVSGAEYAMRHKFSLEIETLPVANQKASGRCWLFAATNILRERIAKELKLDKFELSQSYLAFWDKFERCNYFLESIIATADLPADDRTVQFILTTGVHDGGQWDMFANIARKYGVVPKDVFDETFQTSNTRRMNYYLNRSLKAAAANIRRMLKEGKDVSAYKEETLGKMYGFLCSCYGEPPKNFDFEYVDKDKAYHIEKGMTAKSFYDKYVGSYLDNIASIITAPTADKPYHKMYTIKMLGNVVGGAPVRHLNLSIDEFKQAILNQLKAGKPVWFGSDVGHDGDREIGIWDDNMFNAELLTGLELDISKADGLDYSFSAMNHAMVLTGVNIVDGKIDRWRIENSWGDEHGKKGYYICSDSWFDKYVYQAAVEKEYLGELAGLTKQEAIELAPWDPMGTLAD